MNTETLFPLFLDFLVKTSLIVLLAGLVERLWRKSTAAQRYIIWNMALVALFALPIWNRTHPGWVIPLGQQPAAKAEAPALPALPAMVVASESTESQPVVVEAAPAPSRWKMPDWRNVVLAIWAGGGVLLIGRRLFGSWQLYRLKKRSVAVEDERVGRLTQRVLSELKIKRRVAVRISTECQVPLTWGDFRPVVLLPTEALTWSDESLLAALRHEVGHIGQRHYADRLIADLVCAGYWMNPLVWLAAHQLRSVQEQATDDVVLHAGTSAEDYAAQLCAAARTVVERGVFKRPAMAMVSRSTLESRVVNILDASRKRQPLTLNARRVGMMITLFMVFAINLVQLKNATAADESKPVRSEGKPSGAGIPGTAVVEDARQIEIETKFVELAPGSGQIEEAMKDADAIYSDPQFQVVIRALTQRKGVDIFSAPRVMAKASQRAVIEVIREFSCPTEWEKDAAGIWQPKTFETKETGVTLKVKPEIQADGSVQLHLKPSVVEFLGFVDLDSGKSAAAKRDPAKGVFDRVVPDLEPLRPLGRVKPVFSERKVETDVTIKSGETVVLFGAKEVAEVKPFEKSAPTRKLIVFVSARIIEPAAGRASLREVKAPLRNLEKADSVPAVIQVAAKVEPEDSSPAKKAAEIILPSVNFRGATIDEALDFFRKKARDLDPKKEGVPLLLQGGAGADAEITINLTAVPLLEAVRYVANLAGLEVVADSHGLTLRLPEPGKTVPGPELAKVSTSTSAAARKAAGIVIPRVELREATVEEAVDFLRIKARELDPEKKGVNLVLQKGVNPEARISLSLTNVPLREALRYIASLADLEISAEPDALSLRPMTVKPAAEAKRATPVPDGPAIPPVKAPVPTPAVAPKADRGGNAARGPTGARDAEDKLGLRKPLFVESKDTAEASTDKPAVKISGSLQLRMTSGDRPPMDHKP